MIKAIDKNIETGRDKACERTSERWEIARKRLNRGRSTPRVPVIDWTNLEARAVLQSKKPPEMDRTENRWLAGPSKLSLGYTPDDWLWDEAWEEATKVLRLGYAYRKDETGRRIHRL